MSNYFYFVFETRDVLTAWRCPPLLLLSQDICKELAFTTKACHNWGSNPDSRSCKPGTLPPLSCYQARILSLSVYLEVLFIFKAFFSLADNRTDIVLEQLKSFILYTRY